MRGQSQSGQGVPRSALGVRRSCAGRTPFLAPPNTTDLVGFCVPQPSGHNLVLGLLSSVHRQATFSTPRPRCQPGDSVTSHPHWPRPPQSPPGPSRQLHSPVYASGAYFCRRHRSLHRSPLSNRPLAFGPSQIELTVPKTCSLFPSPALESAGAICGAPQALRPLFSSRAVLLSLGAAGYSCWPWCASSWFIPCAPPTSGVTAVPAFSDSAARPHLGTAQTCPGCAYRLTLPRRSRHAQ